MARKSIGNVCKNKDPNKANYIKIRTDLKEPVVLKAGDFINVESKKFQLASLEDAVQAGRLSQENGAKARERIEKMADWNLGELILNTKD